MPNMNSNNDSTDGWVADDALENLVMERTLHPDESNEQTASRLMKENAPIVAQSILRLAMYSRSERTRLDAGKYVIDRVLGRVGDAIAIEDDSPISKFISEITEFVAASEGKP